jgi:hypothetical protein
MSNISQLKLSLHPTCYQGGWQQCPERLNVIHYINEKRRDNPNYKVIDVGGGAGSFVCEAGVCSATVDMSDSPSDSVKTYKGDMNCPYVWEEVQKDVDKYGKYDFAICTHTLEDISNPIYVCQKLSDIAKAGYIAVPSKYVEMYRFEGPWRGYLHHRWIYSFRDNKFKAYPKMSWVEHIKPFDDIAKKIPVKVEIEDPNGKEETKRFLQFTEINFFWTDFVQLEIINNDYLGVGYQEIMQMYADELSNDDLDILLQNFTGYTSRDTEAQEYTTLDTNPK